MAARALTEEEYAQSYPNPYETREAVLDLLAVKPWQAKAHPVTFFINANVIDPRGSKVLENHAVKVEKGEIAWVKPQSEYKEEANATVYDLKGKYLSPGLIDAHVHVTAVPGVETMTELLLLEEQQINMRTTFVLKSMLSRGFTSVRDTGGASKFIADALAEGLLEGPRLFQCGKAISQTGGHGDLFAPGVTGGDGLGCCKGRARGYGRTADGVPGVLKATREELKQGADFIKIMLGGGVSSESDPIEMVQYTDEEVQAIVKTANAMGKMCTAHAYTIQSIEHAIKNGVKGIEHGNMMDEATAKKMAEAGMWYTPTISCNGIMIRPPYERFLRKEFWPKNAMVSAMGLNALKVAHAAGVQMCYGSDLLVSMHALQTEEFYVRSRVLPNEAILKHATINPAKMLKREGKLGEIIPGAIADLIVLEKNPLEDITVLDRPELYLKAVFKEGRLKHGGL